MYIRLHMTSELCIYILYIYVCMYTHQCLMAIDWNQKNMVHHVSQPKNNHKKTKNPIPPR